MTTSRGSRTSRGRQPGRQPGRRLAAIAGSAVLLAILALPGLARAFDLPPSEAGRSVYDFAGIWIQPAISEAQQIADAARARTGVQMAIVSIPTGDSKVTTSDAEADAIRIMDAWGVGRAGVNDGLVIVYDMDRSGAHGQVYLYGGTGFLSTYFTEADLGTIVSAMLPPAHDGRFDESLLVGLRQLDAGLIAGGNPGRGRTDTVIEIAAGLAALPAVFLLLAFLFTWLARGRDASAPRLPGSSTAVRLPAGATPAMACMLRLERDTPGMWWAGLIDIAQRGFLVISQGARRRVSMDLAWPGPETPEISRPLGLAGDELEAALRERAGRHGGTLSYATLTGAAGARIRLTWLKAIARDVIAAGWFREDPLKATSRWQTRGGIVAVGGMMVLIATAILNVYQPPGRVLLAAALGIDIVVGFGVVLGSFVLTARTRAGAEAFQSFEAARRAIRRALRTSDSVVGAWQAVRPWLPWVETPDDLVAWSIGLGVNKELGKLFRRSADIPEPALAAVQGGALGMAATPSPHWHPAWYTGDMQHLGTFVGSVSTSSGGGGSSSGGGYGGGSSSGGGGAGGGF